jgi:hypothetical protein
VRKLRFPSFKRSVRGRPALESESSEIRDLRLVGRIVVRSGTKLVIEIELREPLEWKPAAVATLLLSGGLELEAVVDLARSTRSGRHARGTTLRLTLEAARELAADEPREIVLENAGERVRIEIEG